MDFDSISVVLGGGGLLYFVCLVAATAFSFFLYRTTLVPISTLLRRSLAVIRALALSLLLFLILEPVLVLGYHTERKPAVAILIDDSECLLRL